MMKGEHAPQVTPLPGKLYAMTLDVAGEDEAVIADPESGEVESLANPKRDSTALTVFEVDLASVDDPLINKPTYKVVQRREWVGVKHATLYGAIKAMAELFAVRYLVVDCTGVGAGLTSFLSASLGDKVVPFEFNVRTKSDLLWDFLGIIDSGRYKDCAAEGVGQALLPDIDQQAAESETFWNQIQFCEFEILPGPQKRVRWGVPDGRRDPATGDLVHDDLLISAALCAELDAKDWAVSAPTFVIQARDPLDDLDKGF